jgi:hypothetical protein
VLAKSNRLPVIEPDERAVMANPTFGPRLHLIQDQLESLQADLKDECLAFVPDGFSPA